jgi:hypothetical protein
MVHDRCTSSAAGRAGLVTEPKSHADDITTGPPVACSLNRAGLAEQAGRWARLAGRALAGHATTAAGVRLRFRPEPGAEAELRALVAVETGCCPWATWTIEAGAEQLVLDVRSAGDGVAVLHGMFTGLRRARSTVGRGVAVSAPGDDRL